MGAVAGCWQRLASRLFGRGFAGGVCVGVDAVVDDLLEVDVVVRGRDLGGVDLRVDDDGALAVVRAGVLALGTAVGLLAGRVEHAVGGAHVGVRDGLDAGLDGVGDLVGVLVLPRFLGRAVAGALAAQVDVLLAGDGVGGDGGRLERQLGARLLAGEVPGQEGHPANLDGLVSPTGVAFRSRAVANGGHLGRLGWGEKWVEAAAATQDEEGKKERHQPWQWQRDDVRSVGRRRMWGGGACAAWDGRRLPLCVWVCGCVATQACLRNAARVCLNHHFPLRCQPTADARARTRALPLQRGGCYAQTMAWRAVL